MPEPSQPHPASKLSAAQRKKFRLAHALKANLKRRREADKKARSVQ